MSDFWLTQLYRTICEDVLLMYDVLILNPRFDKPEDRTWHEAFVEGLAVVMYAESKELVPVPTSPDENQTVEYTNSPSAKNKLMREMLWELLYGVIFQFYIEEVSQFPFWSAKVALCTERFDGPIVTSWVMLMLQKFREGPQAVYHGSVPFVLGACVKNIAHFELSLRRFLAVVMARIPKIPSFSYRQLKDGTAQAPITVGTSVSVQSTNKSRREANAAAKDVEAMKTTKLQFASPGLFRRLALTILAQPFFTLAVHMIKNPGLAGHNCIMAYLKLVKQGGFAELYTGVKAALGMALIPFSHVFLVGIPETIGYRCILGQGVASPSGREAVGHLSVLTSVVVAHSVLVHEGGSSMLRYGILTACQALPGFITFVSAKAAMWVAFGNTRHRRRQVNRRKEILDEHWQRMCVPMTSPRSQPFPPRSASHYAPSDRTAAATATSTAGTMELSAVVGGGGKRYVDGAPVDVRPGTPFAGSSPRDDDQELKRSTSSSPGDDYGDTIAVEASPTAASTLSFSSSAQSMN